VSGNVRRLLPCFCGRRRGRGVTRKRDPLPCFRRGRWHRSPLRVEDKQGENSRATSGAAGFPTWFAALAKASKDFVYFFPETESSVHDFGVGAALAVATYHSHQPFSRMLSLLQCARHQRLPFDGNGMGRGQRPLSGSMESWKNAVFGWTIRRAPRTDGRRSYVGRRHSRSCS
jgi:hypothetical protein